MLKTIARMLYKACPRCHGDLILDEFEQRETGELTYECLQCGRTTRMQRYEERRLPIAA